MDEQRETSSRHNARSVRERTANGLPEREGIERDATTVQRQGESPVQSHRGDLVRAALGTTGRPLPEAVRHEMQHRLGIGLSDVRLHSGPVARASADALDAEAYTSGNHVVLRRGPHQFDAGSRELLRHELVHVVQQHRGPVPGTTTSDGLRLSHPQDSAERAAAQGVAPPTDAQTPVVQREETTGQAATGRPDRGDTGVQRGGTADFLPVQRDGGHGGITPRADGTILQKPTTAAEAEFYENMRKADGDADPIVAVIPKSYTAKEVEELESKKGPPAQRDPAVGRQEAPPSAVEDEDRASRRGATPEIFIESIKKGMNDAKLLDVKLGSATAGRTELIRGGMGPAAAWWKKMKMKVSDRLTGSKRRGYRVVDAPSAEGASRMWTGYQSKAHLRGYLRNEAWDFGEARDAIVEKLTEVRKAAAESAYTFIAASVLIAVERNRGESPVKVVLIDFAHPIHQDKDEKLYSKYRRRFLDGLDDLIKDFRKLQPSTDA